MRTTSRSTIRLGAGARSAEGAETAGAMGVLGARSQTIEADAANAAQQVAAELKTLYTQQGW